MLPIHHPMVRCIPSVNEVCVPFLTLARCTYPPDSQPATAPAPADSSSPASAAQPATTPTPPVPELSRPNYALHVTIPLSFVAYYFVARAVGIDLPRPDLVEPWRSILAVTAAVAATFFGCCCVSESISPTPLADLRNFGVLLTVSVLAWMVMVIQVVRDRGRHDPLAELFMVSVGLVIPFFVVAGWAGKPFPLLPLTPRTFLGRDYATIVIPGSCADF